MHVIPETLKKMRETLGLSQRALAERAKVAKRTISRLEGGETPPEKVRSHTVESLAKALGVEPGALAKPHVNDAERDAVLRDAGYRRKTVHLDLPTRVNYRWVTHHYGVSVQDLFNAAPWMFTLLAEMSLADRRRKLEAAKDALSTALECMPKHLSHGTVGWGDFEHAEGDEQESLAARDIFGKVVLETDHGADPFDPSGTNPFVEFLRGLAESTNSDSVDAKLLEMNWGDAMPRWPVFQAWLAQLTNGDYWARHALEHGHARIEEIPEALMGEDQATEREAFLAAKVPPEVREREERDHLKFEL